jgi:hypothetical protein
MSYSLAFLAKGRPPGTPDRPLVSSSLPTSTSGRNGGATVPRSRRGSTSSQSSLDGAGVGSVAVLSTRGGTEHLSANKAYLDSLAALDEELKRESAEAELAVSWSYHVSRVATCSPCVSTILPRLESKLSIVRLLILGLQIIQAEARHLAAKLDHVRADLQAAKVRETCRCISLSPSRIGDSS